MPKYDFIKDRSLLFKRNRTVITIYQSIYHDLIKSSVSASVFLSISTNLINTKVVVS